MNEVSNKWLQNVVKIKGVVNTRVGYTGGNFENPTYKDVCAGTTGHAEVVEIVFDTKIITFSELLKHFWKIHNPCSLNRQGPDIGKQYRSAVFVTSSAQEDEVLKQKKIYNEKKYNNILTYYVYSIRRT